MSMSSVQDKPKSVEETLRAIMCPQCQSPLPGDARTCPECGVDLALLSLLGEKAYLEGFPDAAPISSTPQWLVPRIGEYLLGQNLLSQEELERALRKQKESAAQGHRILLGQTLIQMGYLDRDTLDRAITQQIIELHAALQESNKTLELRVSERTAELRRALERLAEINQIKANFISNISHELRTPLAQIKGYVELFLDHTLGDLTPEQDSAVSVMRRATDRLTGLIDDLIEFSTASKEGLTLRFEEILLGDMIADVIKRSQEKAGKAGVDLHAEIDAQQTLINVDRERLSWVLFQLVDNGIKFTPADGKVTILTQSNDGTIEFRVADTGIGIPPDRMGEIFEPFHQLDDAATRRYGGTGLGLALVKIILEAHGSELTVDSVEGKGSTFSFIIPVSGKSS